MDAFPEKISLAGYELYRVPATFEMAQAIFDIFAADMKGIRFWMPRGKCGSVEDVFLNYSARYKRKNSYIYGIFKDGEFLGEIGFNGSSSFENKRGVIGYWLKKEVRRNGIISLLMPELMRIGFQDVGYETLVIECDPENAVSRHVAEKFGFSLDGILRGRIVWSNGELHDECVYSKLKSEWEKEK